MYSAFFLISTALWCKRERGQARELEMRERDKTASRGAEYGASRAEGMRLNALPTSTGLSSTF